MGMVYAVACDSTYTGEFRPDSASFVVVSKVAEQAIPFYAYAQSTDDKVYEFSGWSEEEGGSIVSTSNPYQVNVMSHATASQTNIKVLYANFFEKNISHITLIEPTHGSYTATDSVITITDYSVMSTREKVYFSATPAEGYKLMGWYVLDENGEKSYFSSETDSYKTFQGDATIGADFIKENMPVFTIKGSDNLYTDLNAVIKDAKEGDVVSLVGDGELEAGDYEIPAGIVLLIPFDKDNTCYTGTNRPLSSVDYEEPTPYRTLTLLDGAHLYINGALSISSNMFAVNTKVPPLSSGGHPNGEYGNIVMEKGSEITVNPDAFLFAYGYILGEGRVNAKSGSTVYEAFQLSEFRGGTALDAMSEGYVTVFPLNQYFIQNVEVPMTLEQGAVEMVTSGIYVEGKSLVIDPFVFIGENGMFKLDEGSKLTKYFDPTRDRQVYELDGNASFGGIELKMNGIIVKSKNYVLPLTNNLSVFVNSGTLTINQTNGMSLLPDAELTIRKDAKLLIMDSKLYVYDSEDWGEYSGIRKNYWYHEFTPIKSPSMTYVRTSLSDAKLDIQGAVETDNGVLYTTEHGANICCSEGRGQITFNNGVMDMYTYEVEQENTSVKFIDIPVTNAKLKNSSTAAGDYTLTDDVPAGTTYYFHQETGAWDTYEIPVAIDDVVTSSDATIYNVGGIKINTLNSGINIVKMSDGSVKKIIK